MINPRRGTPRPLGDLPKFIHGDLENADRRREDDRCQRGGRDILEKIRRRQQDEGDYER
jgi:hypothetical protein